MANKGKNRNQNKNAMAKGKKGNKLSDNPVEVLKNGPFDTVSARPPRTSKSFTVRITTQTGGLLTVSASATQNPAYYFSLADLDGYSAYTGLFDQYKIEAVNFRLIPMQNAIGLSTNSTTTCVTPYVVVDYDDANAISTAAVARVYESCIIVPPGVECSRTFRPRIALAAYSSTFVSFENSPPQWIDAASPSVQHYGVKLFVPQATAAQTQLQSWTVERTYWISFRKVHG
jgi:hypothetical protein